MWCQRKSFILVSIFRDTTICPSLVWLPYSSLIYWNSKWVLFWHWNWSGTNGCVSEYRDENKNFMYVSVKSWGNKYPWSHWTWRQQCCAALLHRLLRRRPRIIFMWYCHQFWPLNATDRTEGKTLSAGIRSRKKNGIGTRTREGSKSWKWRREIELFLLEVLWFRLWIQLMSQISGLFWNWFWF